MNCTRVNQGFVWVYKCAWSGDHPGTQLTLLPASRRAEIIILLNCSRKRPRRRKEHLARTGVFCPRRDAGASIILSPAGVPPCRFDIYVVRRPRWNGMDDQEYHAGMGWVVRSAMRERDGGSEKYIGVRRISPQSSVATGKLAV